MDQNLDYCEPNIKVYTINDRIVPYRMMCTKKKEEKKKVHQHRFQLQLPPRFYLHSGKLRCVSEKQYYVQLQYV